MENTTQLSNRIEVLRIKEVIARTKLSRSTIYGKINSKSNQYDPDFPLPLKLGGSSIAWLETELIDWLKIQIARR